MQNVSISGTGTADSLARFDHDVTPLKPTFVILATSIINDGIIQTPVAAVQAYTQNTHLLIRKVEGIGAIPIVVAPYPNVDFTDWICSAIKGIYATLNAEGVPLLDFLDGTNDGQGHWVAGLSLDGTHPTDAGHALLFDCIPLTLFTALQNPMPPINPHGFGSWTQGTDQQTEGDVEIMPSTGMGSWTVSFWTKPSTAATERTLLNVNAGAFQLHRAGTTWKLWNGGTNLATVEVRGISTFHHVALTYQSVTGILTLYVDAQLYAQTVIPGASPVTILSIGGDPANAGWNAAGDSFTDVILYRAPLAQTDIQAIRNGQTPWKSIEAWLPLAYSPDRPMQNLAASIPTVVVHGTWTWSNQGIPPDSPIAQPWLAQPALPRGQGHLAGPPFAR